ncbi:hypothetical protein J3R83DRAFT_11667 [Lanmaoa asiatica]|nr:hypothetical protein J3R83DRAFT_11667 [Lanmaoa asiatica]
MAIGVLTTENRKTLSHLHQALAEDQTNAACLSIKNQYNSLGNMNGEDLAALCSNFLHEMYNLQEGVQVGTYTNRWYDKLQIIVCMDGTTGINFEHTGVNGQTILCLETPFFCAHEVPLSDLQLMCSKGASCSWHVSSTLQCLHSSMLRSSLMQSLTNLPRPAIQQDTAMFPLYKISPLPCVIQAPQKLFGHLHLKSVLEFGLQR